MLTCISKAGAYQRTVVWPFFAWRKRLNSTPPDFWCGRRGQGLQRRLGIYLLLEAELGGISRAFFIRRLSIQFLGAAQTVTGSCFLVQNGSQRVLVDCGL